MTLSVCCVGTARPRVAFGSGCPYLLLIAPTAWQQRTATAGDVLGCHQGAAEAGGGSRCAAQAGRAFRAHNRHCSSQLQLRPRREMVMWRGNCQRPKAQSGFKALAQTCPRRAALGPWGRRRGASHRGTSGCWRSSWRSRGSSSPARPTPTPAARP